MLRHLLFCLLSAALVGGPAHEALAQSSSTLSLAAQDDWAETPSNGSVTIHVLSNDSSPSPFDPSSIRITSQPLYGEVSLNASTGGVTYTPDEGYSGEDAFAYTVANTDGDTSNVATVSVVVTGNEPPYIDEFWAYQGSGNIWILEGHVIDEYPGLCTIHIGGVWAGETADVEADGTFYFAKVLHGGGGLVTVQATDLYGLTSNIREYEIGGY